MGAFVARLVEVAVHLGHTEVINDLSLDLIQGRQLVVLGPSGAGKSTLLRLLSGDLTPTRGRLERDHDHLRQAVVFQQPALFPWLTIRENISLGQRFGFNRPANAARVDELISLLGLGTIAERYPDEVSGGQAQRAALARGLAIDPELLLNDEPFSALDPVTRSELQAWLREATQRDHLTTVTVTHDIDEALVLGDDIVLFGHHGTIVQRWSREPGDEWPIELRAEIRRGFDQLDKPTRDLAMADA